MTTSWLDAVKNDKMYFMLHSLGKCLHKFYVTDSLKKNCFSFHQATRIAACLAADIALDMKYPRLNSERAGQQDVTS